MICIAGLPDKTDAVLVVDPDAMLSVSVAFERLQIVSGRRCQIFLIVNGHILHHNTNEIKLNGKIH